MSRDAILRTAIQQFGKTGFDGTSTRDIARAAGTAMSSITYHFGGKEGLHLACADHIAAQIRGRQNESLSLLVASTVPPSPSQAIQILLRILDNLAAMMLEPQSEHWASFIVREQQAPTLAFERLYSGVMGEMVEGCLKLLMLVRPRLAEREARALTMLLFGQALVLRAARASVCRALQTASLGETENALLRDQLRQNTLAILTGGTSHE